LLEQGYEVQARDVLLPLTEYFHPRSALQPLPDTSEIRDLATDYYEDKVFEIDILLDILEQMEIDYREMDVNDVVNTEIRIEDIEILEDIVYRFNSFSFWWTPKDITDAYLGRANAFLCLGSAEDYYETLLLAQSRGQNDVRIDRALSNYEAAGDPAAAETRFAHALEMEPGNYFLLLDYGFFNEVNEDYAEAEAIYRKAIDIYPGYAVGYKMLGDLLEKMGDTEGAMEAFRQGASVEPGWFALIEN